jgi:hypothetical protein
MLKEFQDRHDKNVKDKLTFKNGMGASLLSNKSNTIVLPLLLDWLRKSKGLNFLLYTGDQQVPDNTKNFNPLVL